MDLENARKRANKMIENFVNKIGLDGKEYVSQCDCPMIFGKAATTEENNGKGCKYITPGSMDMEKILSGQSIDADMLEQIEERGLILIDERYANEEPSPDLYVSIMHETFHSNRNILIYDAIREDKNESAYNYKDGKIDQNTTEYGFKNVDAQQDVVLGSIDTSQNSIKKYEDKSNNDISKIEEKNGKQTINHKLNKQRWVDEALIETMSVLAYQLYRAKEKGKDEDVWRTLEDMEASIPEEDVAAMSKIIIEHHDFELFNWMLDPITYSNEDIHYDFFADYTKNDDKDLINNFWEIAEYLDDSMMSEFDDSIDSSIKEDEKESQGINLNTLFSVGNILAKAKEAEAKENTGITEEELKETAEDPKSISSLLSVANILKRARSNEARTQEDKDERGEE